MNTKTKNNKIRILLISFEWPPYKDGGLSRYSYELVEALKENEELDLHVLVAIPNNKNPTSNEKYVEFIKVPFFYNRVLCYFFFSLKIYISKIIYIRKDDFDIIHALSPFSYFLIPKPKHCKFVSTHHNTFKQQIMNFYSTSWIDAIFRKTYYHLLSYWEKKLCAMSDLIIAVSNSTKRDLVEFHDIPEDKIKTIYNGINLRKFGDSHHIINGNKKHTLLFVGRLVPRKDIKTLVEAVKLIKREVNNIELLICGKGETNYELQLNNLVEEHQLQNNVKFLGFIPENMLSTVYSQSDIFVFPSLVEGFGLVLLEAMSYGKPVVASDIGGVNEVIRNEIDGILVKPQNPEYLAKAIIEILRDEKLYIKYSKNARLRANQFSWTTSAKELSTCYQMM